MNTTRFLLVLIVLSSLMLTGCATNFAKGENGSLFESHMYVLKGSHSFQGGIGKPADQYSTQPLVNPNVAQPEQIVQGTTVARDARH
jgi:hypothetical protein